MDYYPVPLRDAIDELNERIYHTVNNGVYKAGFARNQRFHEEAVKALFETLDELDLRRQNNRYLGRGAHRSRLASFPHIAPFDAVYVTHFKCNLKRIADYEHLSRYLKLYWLPY